MNDDTTIYIEVTYTGKLGRGGDTNNRSQNNGSRGFRTEACNIDKVNPSTNESKATSKASPNIVEDRRCTELV